MDLVITTRSLNTTLIPLIRWMAFSTGMSLELMYLGVESLDPVRRGGRGQELLLLDKTRTRRGGVGRGGGGLHLVALCIKYNLNSGTITYSDL